MTLLEMDAAERARLKKSAIVSLALWTLVAIAALIVPVSRAVASPPEFPSVTLRLSSAETEVSSARTEERADAQPKQAASARKPAADAKSAVEPASTVKSSAKPVTKPSPKPDPSKSASSSASSGGLGIPDFAPGEVSSSGTASHGAYLDFSQETVPVAASTPARGVNELEGAAATTGNVDRGTSVSSRKASASDARASRETAKSLEAIEASSRSSASGGVGDSSLAAEGAASTGDSSAVSDRASTSARATSGTAQARTERSSIGAIVFQDGVSRRLLKPAEPAIVLPERLVRLIDSDRSVYVSFVVRADGSVPRSTVSFSPQALLPPEVRDFLAGEFSSWLFERGVGDGQARFAYSIRVR